MPSYYLSTFVGSGAPGDEFRPSGADLAPSWSAIDLRPDGSVAAGRALLVVPSALPADSTRLVLGDDIDGVSATVRNAIQSRLGVTLTATRLRQIVAELLIEHGDDGSRSRWNTLKPGADRWYRIWLGGTQIYALANPAGGATVADNFNRANNTNIGTGAPVAWTEVAGDWQIDTNRLMNAAASGGNDMARCDTQLATADHSCTCTLILLTSATGRSGPMCRCDPSANTAYFASATQDTTNFRISKVVAGNATQLANNVGGAANGQTCVLTCNGSTISATLTGGPANLSVTDTSITSGVRAGVYANFVGAANRQGVDDWSATDVPVARSVGVGSGGVAGPAAGPFATGTIV